MRTILPNLVLFPTRSIEELRTKRESDLEEFFKKKPCKARSGKKGKSDEEKLLEMMSSEQRAEWMKGGG